MSDLNEEQKVEIEVEISTTTSTTEIILINENKQEEEQTSNEQVIIVKAKKKVTFPEDIIKGYSDPPKRWIPGSYSTNDLLESYCKACEKHKCKPLNKLLPLLKALQDIDCKNGEKVNVLSLKNEKLDLKQIESLEEIFKRLSFKSIDLEGSQFDADDSGATMFEILDYYDTCEKLILTNNKTVGVYGLQLLSRLIRKSCSLENLEMRGYVFPDYYHFTYFARAMRLTTCLKILHLDNSNIQGKFLISLLNAIKENEYIKEIYLPENKLSSTDGMYIGGFLKENCSLEVLDIRSNQLNDLGLSHICSGLSEKGDEFGLKTLIISNNNITVNGISYLTKAIIHNRSLKHLNISQNNLTNEGLIALKDSLISNKQLNILILQKVKLTDEGVIALAEYIAETQSLKRLDIRENDIRLGGVMALSSSLKFNKTLTRIDIDKELKRDSNIKDYVEQTKRLNQEIIESCNRNKQYEVEKEAQLKANNSIELKLEENADEIVLTENKQEDDEAINNDKLAVNSIDEYFDEIEDYQVINHESSNSSFECVDFTSSSTTVISTNNKKFSICAVDSNDNSLTETNNNHHQQEVEEDLNLIESVSNFNLNEQESLIDAKLKIIIESNKSDSSQMIEINESINNDEIQDILTNIIDSIVFNFERDITSNSEMNIRELIISPPPPPPSSSSLSSSCSSLSPNELIVNHSDILLTNGDEITETKPFFTSKLTNSQLSEELSNEIGLE